MNVRGSKKSKGLSRLTAYLLAIPILLNACTKAVLQNASTDGISSAGTATDAITVNNDTTNNINWATQTTILSNKDVFTITGSCQTGVTSVRASLNDQPWVSSLCENGGYSLAFTGATRLTSNNTYVVKLTPSVNAEGGGLVTTPITRTYDFYKVNGSTLVALDSWPANTTDDTIDLVGTCQRKVNMVVEGSAFVCQQGETIRLSISLSLGTNDIDVSWADLYGNDFSTILSIQRNAPGLPELVSYDMSPGFQSRIDITNPSTGAAAPYMEFVASVVYANERTTTDNRIPASVSDSDPGSGLGISLVPGASNMIYCENQDVTGTCVP